MESAIWLNRTGRIGGIAMKRWQMSRAGILNFWYYDEEEFHLEEGRLILRGANGSGKSVTMQSFIPLVLDGDKRPERLDPFGSRDRRLEYYLLGEADQGHIDRTGYIWLEFFHPLKNLYKTIGIGLRARRGVSQLGFWGFLLDDGRRINQDFYLYDYPLWIEQGKKVPLNRKSLEKEISAGGQVVQEQAAYRDMVNKAVFGFRENEFYKDLLKLLLELRSPKLSKDFKPSSIYEILTKALPPLMEEDMSSLSDVLEDMDQISDYLQELQLHLSELKNIENAYNRYNQFLLNTASIEVLEQRMQYTDVAKQVTFYEKKLFDTQQLQKDTINILDSSKQRIRVVEAQLEVLNRSEAMEKQRELEISEEQLNDINKQLVNVKNRIDQNGKMLKSISKIIEESRKKRSDMISQQQETLSNLEDLARIIEFGGHNLYHNLWSKGIPENNQWIKGWIGDLEVHKGRLKVAQKTAREEDEASKNAKEAEIRLGEVHQERITIEEEWRKQEEKLEAEKDTIREGIVQWHRNLEQLSVTGDRLRMMLQALTNISTEERSYEPVRNPVFDVYNQQKESLMENQMQLNQERQLLLQEKNNIQQELEKWKQEREPEPARKESRDLFRKERANGTGAPLFAACEFNETVDEVQRACLEETLEQAGLLDAWIFPGGKVGLIDLEKEEEIWIEPKDLTHEETLAKVLHPMPPHNSGLSEKDIIMALNSFEWASSKSGFAQEKKNSSEWLAADGTFRLGSLVGRNLSKSRAEYIGKEARLRTKQLTMMRLEEQIKILIEELRKIDEKLSSLNYNREKLEYEIEAFPNDQQLQKELENLAGVSYKLNQIIVQEKKEEFRYKQKLDIWRSLQIRLVEETADWSRLKKEHQINEAIKNCEDYRGNVSELNSLWTRYHELTQYLNNNIYQHEELKELVEKDREEVNYLEQRQISFSARIDQLKKLIHEMGIEEVHEQIKKRKAEKNDLDKKIEGLQDLRISQERELGEITSDLRGNQGQLEKEYKTLNIVIDRWKNEIKLGLIPSWKEFIMKIEDDKNIDGICRQVVKAYNVLYENISKDRIDKDFIDIFGKCSANLQDYALEIEGVDTGRMIILSKRDKMNPLPLSSLLDELIALENEQLALLTEKDRELYEEIILGSVGKAIRNRILRARDWVAQMDQLMRQRDTSSGLKLSLKWIPLARKTEEELDTETLVELLMRDGDRMNDEEIEQVINHFRSRIQRAKENATDDQGSLQRHIYQLMDYRSWFEFRLEHRKGEQPNYTELTDSKFNVLSGGEKAMSMYIPLFAATYSRYSDASPESPKIISLDEAFAGVDDANMRDMFQLLTDMGFDYMMTSQVLWGCYDTVPNLAIYELYRPKDAEVVTLLHYRWNGKVTELVED